MAKHPAGHTATDHAGLLREIVDFILTPAGVTLLVAVVITAGGLAAWVYQIGRDVGDRSAAAYKAANEMQLPALALSAREAADSLKKATQEFSGLVDAKNRMAELQARYDQLQAQLDAQQKQSESQLSALRETRDAEIRRLSAELEKMRSALSTATAALASARSELALYVSPELNGRKIDRNSSITAYKGVVTVGYADPPGGRSTLFVNNVNHPLQAGLVVTAENTGDSNCRVILDRVDFTYIIVTIRCAEKVKTP